MVHLARTARSTSRHRTVDLARAGDDELIAYVAAKQPVLARSPRRIDRQVTGQ